MRLTPLTPIICCGSILTRRVYRLSLQKMGMSCCEKWFVKTFSPSLTATTANVESDIANSKSDSGNII